MIDPATGWFEIKAIRRPDAHSVMEAFYEAWLCRYPRPQYIGYDNGGEFKDVFGHMCTNYGIKGKPSTSFNPQSNGIIERVHQVLGNALRTFELEEQELDTYDPWGPFLASAAWAIRSTFHTTLEATPGQLIYGRDMVLPLTFKADWARISMRKKQRVEENNARENRSRIAHEYKFGDKVLLKKTGHVPKLSKPMTGPYTVLAVNANGTVRIMKGVVEQTVNIRRLHPYFESDQSGSECSVACKDNKNN